MKTLLFLTMVFFLYASHAATYYISSSSGDDSRSSSQAANSSTPWKSLSKLNSFFGSLQPGDAVLLKRGDTFYGSITVNKSGTSSSPITIGAYGSGDRPIITSLTTLSGWTANSSYRGVYDCSANSLLDIKVNMLLMNDVQKGMGRYPNLDASNKGYLTLESHSGKTSIYDKELTSTINWKGAEVVIRTCHWILERFLITGHSGSTIYYSGNYDPRDHYGYFIQNSIKTLDQPGEWYYNPSTKKVSMYFGSSSPSSYSVKAATFSNLIVSYNKSYVVFDNLTLKGANGTSVNISSGSNINIRNCDILFSGTDAVKVIAHTNFKLENSNVVNTNNNGVAMGLTAKYAVIRNNVIKNTYTIAGAGQGGNGQGLGIGLTSDGLAEYNQVINSGFMGIRFDGNNCVVKNNYVDTYCFVKDDGSGIYTYNGPNSTNYGNKITGNIVMNGMGAGAGTNTTNSSADGIYLDDDVNGVEITGNTIANSNRGLYLHNSRNVIVKNNTCYNNNSGQLHMKHDEFGGALRNHNITNNIFFSKTSGQSVTYMVSTSNDYDLKSIGTMDYNYYARPMNNTNLIFTTTGYNTSWQTKNNRDLPEWKSTYQKDPNSQLSTKTFQSYPDDNITFVYNASQSSKTVSLNATYVDAKSVKYSNSITLQPYTSAVLIKDGASTTTTGNTAPTISITSPSASAGFTAPAAINVSATVSDPDGTISKVEFYNGNTLINTQLSAPYSMTWNNVAAGSYILTAKATDNDGAVTTSASVAISVANSSGNAAPVVSFIEPTSNASYKGPATITMTAKATDADGTISKVEFYNGSSLLHTEYHGTYTYTWSKVPSGNYTITAKATDNDGLTTTSMPVKVSVALGRASNNNQTTAIVNNSTEYNLMKEVTGSETVDVKLFPNPATNIIYLNFSRLQSVRKAMLTIRNVAGSTLKSYPIVISGKSLQADISSLNTGTFIISLTGENFNINKKFIKAN